MVDNTKVYTYHGQWDVFKPTDEFKVLIGGAGGIGSFTSLVIGKMGLLDIEVWDADTIEEHNFSNQFYQKEDVTKPKVEALKHNLSLFAESNVTTHNESITPETELDINNNTVVVSAFDSMAARKILWDKAKYKAYAFIDGRMALDDGRVYCVNPRNKADVEFYEATLTTDDAAYQERCTAKTIIYNVVFLAGLIANKVKKVINEEPYNREIIFNLKGLAWLINK